jgi:tyrosinase
MSDPNLAARDPIFWLHHANIDRLWSHWIALGDGRANPTNDAAWMQTKFMFFDENGTQVALSGSEVLETAAQLAYRYDDGAVELAVRPVEKAVNMGTRAPTEVGASRPEGGVTLGTEAVRVRLAISASNVTEAATQERGFRLIIDGIHYTQNPGAYFDVFVGLPEGVAPDRGSRYYAGPLALFALEHQHATPAGGEQAPAPRGRWVRDVTSLVLRLRSEGATESGSVDATFVPGTLDPPADEPNVEAIQTPAVSPLHFESMRLEAY